MQAKSVGWMVALSAADAAAVLALRPDAAAVARTLRHLPAVIARDGADAGVAPLAGAAVWLAACWLGAGLLAAAGTGLPGIAGRLASRLAKALLPRAIRAAVAGSAGVGVLLAPAAALAGGTPAPDRAAIALPAPAWPTDPSTSTPPAWPISPPATHHAPATHHPPPHRPAAQKPPRHRPPRTAPRYPSPGPAVTVRPGDSLWSIAADQLGADPSPTRVAAEWPRWFAANRAVIGDDPTLIRPGQVLHRPNPAHHDPEARR